MFRGAVIGPFSFQFYTRKMEGAVFAFVDTPVLSSGASVLPCPAL